MNSLITKNKATLDSGESKIKKFDDDIKEKQEEVVKTKQLAKDLTAKQKENEKLAEQMFKDIETYNQEKAKHSEEMEEKKALFNQLKRDIQKN